ncbi:hypothetical protein GCM10007418_24520 [Halopseudomonas salina]|uniref:Uncharacterized protein n=1 Tax=Halopseudomonas salina TaxID=1323744 RepID=A0ABQ1PW50_9GAMM|nr:hypothetical protein GCM10007418_24520 [Halopseudomonas salina]
MNRSGTGEESSRGTLVRPSKPLYKTLYDLANCYNESAEIILSTIITTKATEFIAPAIMCRSFAIELLLKFFIAIEKPAARSKSDLGEIEDNLRGHKYSELFDRLDNTYQLLIVECFSDLAVQNTSKDLFREHLINLGDDPFVKWRYIYESPTTKHIDIKLLGLIAKSLGLVAYKETQRKIS